MTSTLHSSRNDQSQFNTIQGDLKTKQKQLIDFSVKAQDFMVKKELKSNHFHSRNMSAVVDNSNGVDLSLQGAPNFNNFLDDSIVGPSALRKTLKEKKGKVFGAGSQSLTPHAGAGAFQLPQIGAPSSPFKGFLDISIVTQKLRKNMVSSGRAKTNVKERLGSLQPIEVEDKPVKFKPDPGAGGVQMSAKVLETWINETLQDAEHLDIPGVILKSDVQIPIKRYGIDRPVLIQEGIPANMVDRIYRALFVYSVGFYELIKKCLQHTDKKYKIITDIWKVFAILLEYCCRTDYRMLIQEITEEHKKVFEDLEEKYKIKFAEQANNEKIIKQNFEILQKYSETLEKERMNERQMRLKLEEEYTQNSKNHEEEVQLRLQFEAKLNEMHGQFRDLTTDHLRATQDLAEAREVRDEQAIKLAEWQEQVQLLEQDIGKKQNKIETLVEANTSLKRDLQIKSNQLTEFEDRYAKIQDELDIAQYKLQDQQKDMTEMKLKTDVLVTANEGLMAEKLHLTTELKDTRSLQKTYEEKTTELMKELTEITSKYQEVQRNMIGNNEVNRIKDEKISKLKNELSEANGNLEEMNIKFNTLKVQQEQTLDQMLTQKKDLEDTVEKLHQTNKSRHDTEIKLGEEIEKVSLANESITRKDELLKSKMQEIDDLDKKVIDLQKQLDTTETKLVGNEKNTAAMKKQRDDKINDLQQIITGEKENREMWIGRYEKEQEKNQALSNQLMVEKKEHLDQQLATKNAQIKLETAQKQISIMETNAENNQKLINDYTAKCEELERELGTQKEVLKQFGQSKNEYIQQLKDELDTVEARFYKIVNENIMLGEDYRSRALVNLEHYYRQKAAFEALEIVLAKTEADKQFYIAKSKKLELDLERDGIQAEDYFATVQKNQMIIMKQEKTIGELHFKIADQEAKIKEHLNTISAKISVNQSLDTQIREYKERIEELTEELKEMEKWGAQRMTPKEEADCYDDETQTDIQMDFFDQIAKGINNPLNQNSSTAMGTNYNNQQSLNVDIDGGLAHNQSLEEQSPGMRSKQSTIQEENSPLSARRKKGGLGSKNNNSLMSNSGLRSLENDDSDEQSQSLKSLMKSKHTKYGGKDPAQITAELNEAKKLNAKKPKGNSNIKGLIKSANSRK